MIIALLAAAMTIAMLIATAFGLQQEADKIKLKANPTRNQGFGARQRR